MLFAGKVAALSNGGNESQPLVLAAKWPRLVAKKAARWFGPLQEGTCHTLGKDGVLVRSLGKVCAQCGRFPGVEIGAH